MRAASTAIALATVFSATLAAAAATPNKRIVGGEEATDKYKFTVSIHNENGLLCGGSLLDNVTVLTASHCVLEDVLDSFVLAGTRVSLLYFFRLLLQLPGQGTWYYDVTNRIWLSTIPKLISYYRTLRLEESGPKLQLFKNFVLGNSTSTLATRKRFLRLMILPSWSWQLQLRRAVMLSMRYYQPTAQTL